jgi:hypothetical protein
MTIAELSPKSPPDESVLDAPGPITPASDERTSAGVAAAGEPAGAVASEPGSDRLRLRPTDPTAATGSPAPDRGFVDGAWWPHSNDLVAELPWLIAQMSERGYRIRRVTYNLDAWAPAPRRLIVDGQVIKLGGFRTQSPAELVLVDGGGWQRTELVVVPPRSDPALAARVLAAAVHDQDRAADILESAAG